jgi:hypothetical protein
MNNITDHAHLVSRSKDTTTYQHASTLQLFQTVEQSSGNGLMLLIFNHGVWQSEGIFTLDQIVHQVANPD